LTRSGTYTAASDTVDLGIVRNVQENLFVGFSKIQFTSESEDRKYEYDDTQLTILNPDAGIVRYTGVFQPPRGITNVEMIFFFIQLNVSA